MAIIAFCKLFLPNSLPRLVIIDNMITLKGVDTELFKLLCITCTVATLENYRAFRVDLLFSYLNKVESITSTYAKSFSTCIKGSSFTIYACNDLPINGMYIICSFS